MLGLPSDDPMTLTRTTARTMPLWYYRIVGARRVRSTQSLYGVFDEAWEMDLEPGTRDV